MSKLKPMTPGVPSSARFRAYLTGLVVTAGLVGVAMRAWALQIDDGDRYRALAERQHAMRLDIPAPRGEVLDARGRPLAVSADTDSIWANPRDVRDVAGTADQLAKIVGDDASVLEAKLAGDRRFVWIERHVSPEIAKAVRAAKLPGIEVAREPRRYYPGKTVAGPVIGRADIDGIGLDGIELSMNELLAGRRSAVNALRDSRGHSMLAEGLAPTEPGATVHLSLDRSIQAIAENALGEAMTTNKAKNGVVVVLDVATGRVLALASSPTYDPNTGDSHGARNRPVTDAYEAGSVMKVFSVAAAIDDGTVTPATEFQIGGSIKIGPKVIRDVHIDPYLTVSDIIKRSSNVGAAKVALRFGREKLYAALKRFGFGTRTGIELPGEQVGMLRDGAHWRDIELATIAFGYGLTVTPLQIAAALAAIGNHGLYREPRIVDDVVEADGTVIYRGNGETRQVLKPKTADDMLVILASVFDKGKFNGTAAAIDVAGFRCGGKTGTANKYDPAIHQYSPNHYLASFAGLAPIDHPRLAIVVMIDDPTGGDHYGGQVSGPVFATVATEALRYLGVPGETMIAVDVNGKPIVDAAGKPVPVDAYGKRIIVPPATKVVAKPAAAVPALDLAPVADAATADTAAPAKVVVPDFRGMGLGRALDLARGNHLAVDVSGSGRVIEQEPPPGPTASVGRVTLRFSDEVRRAPAGSSVPH